MQTNTVNRYNLSRRSTGRDPHVSAIRAINFFQIILALCSVVWTLNTVVGWAAELLSAIFCAGFPLLLAAKAALAFAASRSRSATIHRADLLTAVFAAELLLASLSVVTAMTILIAEAL